MASGARRRWRSAGLPSVRREIPVRTFTDWSDPPPGFVEADLVVHSGPSTRGSYVQTLVLTDIASGWTECAPLLVREQHLLTEVLEKLKAALPFALAGIDTDNDTVFINETLKAYCEANGIPRSGTCMRQREHCGWGNSRVVREHSSMKQHVVSP